MKYLIIRVIKQIKNDKRTLALILFAPLLVLTLLNFLLGDSNYTPKIAVYNVPAPIYNVLKSENVEIIDYDTNNDWSQYLKDGNADAVFYTDNTGVHIKMLESSSKSQIVMNRVQDAIKSINPSSNMDISYVYQTTGTSTFDTLSYVFLGILSFFFVFVVAGMSLVRERSSQTLERFLMSPIKRWQGVLGYTIGYGFFAVIQAILIVLYCNFVLGLHFGGSILLIVLTMMFMAVAAVAFGALVSIFANSEFQVVQFIPVVLIPQIFFSGLIPLDTMPYHLGNIAYITPIYYACTALKKVTIENSSFYGILPYLSALTAYIIILSVLNILALKKYRRI